MSERNLRSRKLASAAGTKTSSTTANTNTSTRLSRNAASTSSSHTSHDQGHTTAMDDPDDPRAPLLGATKNSNRVDLAASLSGRHVHPSSTSLSPELKEAETGTDEDNDMKNLSRKSQWIALALASGACAAFNGVFAKLTTTELTTNFATAIANLIGLSNVEGGVEIVVRAIFFGLNLIFNGIMWALFTKALARGTSTTQVSILNTSSNFMITAVLGFLIFSEKLPPLWFLGAALLVAGNVIIGRREEGEDKDEHRAAENGEGVFGEEGEGLLEGEEVELDGNLATKRKGTEGDVPDLGLEDEESIPRQGGSGTLI